jgi:large subunit ribosomal protein L9
MNSISLILKEDIKSLGKKGELVKVSEGYARNYLLRNNLAIVLDDTTKKIYEKEKKLQLIKLEKKEEFAKNIKNQIEKDYVMILHEKTGKEGRLFGAVTAEIIADRLKKDKNIEIDKRKIEINNPIKSTGIHEIQIKIYKGINAKLIINIKEISD